MTRYETLKTQPKRFPVAEGSRSDGSRESEES